MGIFTKGINKGAYQGKLTCPFTYYDGKEFKTCESTAIRFVENIGNTRHRYRCRKCGRTFQYDFSGIVDVNPYAPFRKGKIMRSIEYALGGRQLKGGML